MNDTERARHGLSRRTFLQGAGIGAVAVGIGVFARALPARGQSPSPAASLDPLATTDLSTVTENWAEPRVWRPIGNDQLNLHVVENEGGFRFSYDGQSPGPTIRMSGEQTLHVRIRNDLGPDDGTMPIGSNPDTVEGYPGPEGQMLATLQGDDQYGQGLNRIPTQPQQDWSLGEHANGVHSAHVTNLHSHGLHVAPGKNDNGTSSDDIFLRIVPADDAKKISQSPGLYAAYQENRDEIIDNEAEFEFRLGNVMAGRVGADGSIIGQGLPHPPGTYWYHPHSHGATQNQVASGMAGFFIVEGDVDSLVNERIAGDSDAKWDEKTGDWDYRERSMLLQRVFLAPTANLSGPNEGSDPDKLKKQPGSIATVVNGDTIADVITMRPGAIERWRILNGSVDGAGFMRFAVLAGEFDTDANDNLTKVDRGVDPPSLRPVKVSDYQPTTVSDGGDEVPIEKGRLLQLSWDGITRVTETASGGWQYQVKDLSIVNGGKEPDFESQQACYVASNLPLCFFRPNELRMGDANRADVFFQAPGLKDGETSAIYTVVSMPTRLHGTPETSAKIMAYVVVNGEHVPGDQDYDFSQLLSGLDVHPYEVPVGEEELRVTSETERVARGISGENAFRTRVIDYGGWGANGLPLIEANGEYVAANPDKEKLSYYSPPPKDSTEYSMPVTVNGETVAVPVTGIQRFPSGDLPAVLLPPSTRTMNIDGLKFFPTSESTPKMLLDTAEEWAVYNQSIDLYSVKPPDSSWTIDQMSQYLEANPELLYYQFQYVDDPPTGAPTSPAEYFPKHRVAYALTVAQVDELNAKRATVQGDPWTKKGPLQLRGRAVDHPFHIHQNPFWLTRIDVPDVNGDYVNILAEPRWSDTVSVPRNGGRAVFRSRFVDYAGEFVDHCHILLHEDNGMMQRVQIVPEAVNSDYVPRESVAGPKASEREVDAIYGKPTAADSWKKSLIFDDLNNTGQVFPGDGFVVQVPDPPTE